MLDVRDDVSLFNRDVRRLRVGNDLSNLFGSCPMHSSCATVKPVIR